MADVLLAVGTRKGLFLARQRPADGSGDWEFTGPHFNAQAVYSVAIDTRAARVARLLAGGTARTGARRSSTPTTWADLDGARAARRQVPEGHRGLAGAGVAVAPGGAREPDVVYAGTEPAALFRSEDGGESFELVRPLWEHPTRSEWVPGGGGEGLHTVLTDPRDPQRRDGRGLHGGVFRTRGRRRELGSPSNSGVSRGVPARIRTRSSASACTRSRGTRRTRTGCICRTTGGCTAATTRARTGPTSARACRPTSASRSAAHPAPRRTWPTSSRSTRTRTGSRPTTLPGLPHGGRRAGAGSR